MLFSEPSEHSEPMERSDNPFGLTSTMMYGLLALGAVGLGYYFMRKPAQSSTVAPASGIAATGAGNASVGPTNASPMTVTASDTSQPGSVVQLDASTRAFLKPIFKALTGYTEDQFLTPTVQTYYGNNGVPAMLDDALKFMEGAGTPSVARTRGITLADAQFRYALAQRLYELFLAEGLTSNSIRPAATAPAVGQGMIFRAMANTINKG